MDRDRTKSGPITQAPIFQMGNLTPREVTCSFMSEPASYLIWAESGAQVVSEHGMNFLFAEPQIEVFLQCIYCV